MDDRCANFFILFGDVCTSAELAGFRIEVQTAQGARVVGVPQARSPAHPADDLDHTGYGRTVRVDTVEIGVQDVVAFTVTAPGQLRPPRPTCVASATTRPQSRRRRQ